MKEQNQELKMKLNKIVIEKYFSDKITDEELDTICLKVNKEQSDQEQEIYMQNTCKTLTEVK